MKLKYFILLLNNLILILVTSSSVAKHTEDYLHINQNENTHTADPFQEELSGNKLRIMTLNLGHGRGNGFHQALTSTDQIIANLEKVAAVIQREQPHVVALQEADGPSFWSGSFNHVEFLLERTELQSSFQGYHVKGMGLKYGTAIMAITDLDDSISIRLQPSAFTLAKGFVISSIRMSKLPGQLVDIVSIHLDFLSAKTRKKQIRTLVESLSTRGLPTIISGDFNTEWNDNDGVLSFLVRELDLTVYQPQGDNLVTFPSLEKRYDWILISKQFKLESMKVILDNLSDHKAVIADVRLVM